jgi:hypothetical protein
MIIETELKEGAFVLTEEKFDGSYTTHVKSLGQEKPVQVANRARTAQQALDTHNYWEAALLTQVLLEEELEKEYKKRLQVVRKRFDNLLR